MLLEQRKIYESCRYSYYIQNDGKVYRIYSKHYDPNKGFPKNKRIYVKGTLSVDGHLKIKLGASKSYLVKNLVAKYFIRGFDPDKHVVYLKDSNPKNCSINNILIVDRTKHCKYVAKKYSTRAIKVRITNQNGICKTYNSLTAAAKDIPINYWTFRQYIKGKCNSRILSDYKIEIL